MKLNAGKNLILLGDKKKQLTVTVHDNLEKCNLPEEFIQGVVKPWLEAKQNHPHSATVTLGKETFDVLLLPFFRRHQGKLKLYAHVALPRATTRSLNQDTIDKISYSASKQIRDKQRVIIYDNSVCEKEDLDELFG